jgi:RimJ/RimL family protein N-acetyltransferase
MQKVVARRLQLAWEDATLHRIEASMFAPNRASACILEKNGFVREGVQRQSLEKNGQLYDTVLYGLLRPVQTAGPLVELTVQDLPEAYALWQGMPGIGLVAADKPDALADFLYQNPGLSVGWREDGRLVATCLCGSDGRRGFLYHVAVAESHRRRGIGGRVSEASLERLRQRSIDKCHLMVFGSNENGQAFWQAAGWTLRKDLALFSKDIGGELQETCSESC